MKTFKILFLFVGMVCCASTAYSQSGGLYLLKEFAQGIIVHKNNSKAAALMNYDAKGRKMNFVEGEDLMLLTNTNFIDTVYIGSRKFIPEKDFFLEVVRVPNGIVYVDWRFKEIIQGKKGAMGLTTHGGGIESVSVSSYNRGARLEWDSTIDVTQIKMANEYRIKTNGKTIIFKDKKGLLKQFPKHTGEIETYINEHTPKWNDPDDMVELADFCLGLKQ